MPSESLKIVLLPGMDGNGELFREFVAALPVEWDTETVVYPADQVLSYVELDALVRAAIPDVGWFVLVAESYSTPLAIRIAATHPERLMALVLCAGFATSPVKGFWHDLTAMLPLRTLRVLFPKFVARTFLLGEDAPDALVTAVAAEIDWVEPEVLASRVREVLMCDVRAELAQIRVPIQYLRAAKDKLVSVECMEEIVTLTHGTAVATIDGPHLLLQREPELCARVIREFVGVLQNSEHVVGVGADAVVGVGLGEENAVVARNDERRG
jgi:pimeloyl-[acyl-carrier protein] methyl ester esterase